MRRLIAGLLMIVLLAGTIACAEAAPEPSLTEPTAEPFGSAPAAVSAGKDSVMVEEMPAPIAQEFSLVLRENQMGVPLDESLEHLNKRIQSQELNLIITAIDIARETGGNLTEPFEKLMFTIRERDKLIGKVKTLTLQAKMQGIIMSLMPIFFGIVVYYMNPEFAMLMLENPYGRILLAIAGVLEIVGIFLLWKLSQVEL